jgi:hypothetical protein
MTNRSIISPQGLLGRTGLALGLTCLLTALASPNADAARKVSNLNVVPTITSISISNGQLFASGDATVVLRGRTNTVPFTAPVNISLAETNGTNVGACPILDLELGPINLDLLGLLVETSPICLQITAYDNAGLLGDLLCSVANLLNAGLSLDQILAGQGALDPVLGVIPGLTPVQIEDLLGGITDLLNEALGNLLDAVLTDIIQGLRGACDILHLELGPVDLTLLGLEVILDDCEGGPVVVDVSAERGPGNLLGNILCGLLGRSGLGSTLGDILGGLLR